MRIFLAFILMCFPAFAEEKTTTNVLPSLNQWTTSGGTNATGGTGHASQNGGTYSTNFDVPLTLDEIRKGFKLNSSVTVDSHSSNSRLSTCSSLTQATDCRDIFQLGITLYDNAELIKKWTHEIELNFTGLKDYTFTNEVLANDYGLLTGKLSFWGIDAGYHLGMYGPVMSNQSLTFTYQTVIEQQILDTIHQQQIQEAFSPPPSINLPLPPINMAPLPPQDIARPPEIASISLPPPPPPRREEARAEAAVEAEVRVEPPPASVAETRPAAASTPRQSPSRNQRIENVVKKIAPSQRYSSVNQTTTIVVMTMLAPKFSKGPEIIETPGFFKSVSIKDNRSLANFSQSYAIFGVANGKHSAMVESQY